MIGRLSVLEGKGMCFFIRIKPRGVEGEGLNKLKLPAKRGLFSKITVHAGSNDIYTHVHAKFTAWIPLLPC
jgi:hypothetical protein